MALELAEQRTELPRRKELLPDEFAVLVGCVGCSSQIAGCTIFRGDRSSRANAFRDLKVCSELTGVPVHICTGSIEVIYGESHTDTCDGFNKPCSDPDARELFEATGLVICEQPDEINT